MLGTKVSVFAVVTLTLVERVTVLPEIAATVIKVLTAEPVTISPTVINTLGDAVSVITFDVIFALGTAVVLTSVFEGNIFRFELDVVFALGR